MATILKVLTFNYYEKRIKLTRTGKSTYKSSVVLNRKGSEWMTKKN